MPTDRLLVYSDTAHGDVLVDGSLGRGAVSVDYPFLVYVAEVARSFGETTIVGRYEARTGEFVPMPEGLDLAPLPSYSSLASIREVVRSTVGTVRGFWRAVGRADVVWAFGPHPFAVLLGLVAIVRRRRVVFGVRQDPVAYFAARRGSSGGWQGRAARILARTFARLAAGRPVTAVGEALAAQYPRSRVYDMRISLTRESEIVPPRPLPADGLVRLITVGRVAPEKSPFLLIEAIRRLNERAARVQLTWVGTGELYDDSVARARELGLDGQIHFAGHVAFGKPLLDAYRSSDMFVHVALTEGVPQVLYEAFAAGLPVVATDVGGVRSATEDGRAALLVPPADLDALVAAIESVVADPALALRLAGAGEEIARRTSLEASAAAAAAFVRG